MTDFSKLVDELREHEGYKYAPYNNDGAGVPTIGIGFALIIYNKPQKRWEVRSDLDSQLQAAGLPPSSQNDKRILQNYVDYKNGRSSTFTPLSNLSFRFSKNTAEQSAEHILRENEKIIANTLGAQWNQYP
ncbi:MAG: hypothetical protein MK052_06165 [Alphaproteobacteria bacterium]|nr:hypothetical protein [Alphaproteobacteria bacterium]